MPPNISAVTTHTNVTAYSALPRDLPGLLWTCSQSPCTAQTAGIFANLFSDRMPLVRKNLDETYLWLRTKFTERCQYLWPKRRFLSVFFKSISLARHLRKMHSWFGNFCQKTHPWLGKLGLKSELCKRHTPSKVHIAIHHVGRLLLISHYNVSQPSSCSVWLRLCSSLSLLVGSGIPFRGLFARCIVGRNGYKHTLTITTFVDLV